MTHRIKRDVSIVMLEFWSIVRAFEESIVGREEMGAWIEFYDRYDGIWSEYVKRWNAVDGVVVIYEGAFMNYIIDDLLDVYRIKEV